mgnify:CR=1 FL=1
MKKVILINLIILFSISIMAQMKAPVAVDDTVYVNMGETTTVYPLLNDYDQQGGVLKIVEVNGSGDYDFISFTDSTITFKIPDFYLFERLKINYVLDYESFNSHGIGDVHIFSIIPNFDTLEINQVAAPIYPMNVQFFDVYFDWSGPNYHYPKDSPQSPLFSTSLWVGGKDASDQLHVAAERYRQLGSDFWPGPLNFNASIDSVTAANWFRTWKVSREQINNHIANYNQAGYEMPEAIANWPAHGDANLGQDAFIAPFVDVDQDLEYHPEQGDYPFIKGDQTVFFIYNDQLDHTETGGAAMGLEIHCMAWGVDEVRDGSPYNSTMFYSYKIFNKSAETYYDTYLGIFADIDLGFGWDDYIGCHVENGNFYAYNGNEIDGNGEPEAYGENIPSQSICILSGPFIDDDNEDNPLGECDESINGSGFGDGEVDNERYGMNRFVYFNNGVSSYMTDPSIAPEYYDYMRGIWMDGSSMLYGGNGHAESGGNPDFQARFMFPGDSDPCNWGTEGVDPGELWTEESAGNDPEDRRGLASMGPFTFEAGSVEYLDIALVTAPGDQTKSSKELLQDYIAQIKQDYLIDPMNFGNQYVGIEEPTTSENLLQVYPNPVTGDQIQFELVKTEQTEYVIYNTSGQEVQSGQLPAQQKQNLNIGQLQTGWYILEIKTAERIYRSKLIK